ncbi:MAG: undecaprenyl-diphosphate phosphatase [Oscillospiraceae bacterium]|jgi:undecaprenyl-diphosphatase|nr:undecaprenyl-diphosphate phosphatase [Oscillospiraceae bacterium]
MLFELLKAVCLGIIEGVTEWLPISSTGHMLLADELLKLDVSSEFFEMFLVTIQLGAVLSVAVLYRHALFPIRFERGAPPAIKRDCLALWGKCLVACAPVAVLGLLFDDKLNELFYNHITVAAALVFYGVIFIIIEKTGLRIQKTGDPTVLTYRDALFIGFFQILSLMPGASRSGVTILGAMLLGASRETSAEFSFFLALPVMLGASFLKLVKFGFAFTAVEAAIGLTGAATAFLISIPAVKFFVGYVKKRGFTPFGIYRIALGIAVLAVYFAGGAAAS